MNDLRPLNKRIRHFWNQWGTTSKFLNWISEFKNNINRHVFSKNRIYYIKFIPHKVPSYHFDTSINHIFYYFGPYCLLLAVICRRPGIHKGFVLFWSYVSSKKWCVIIVFLLFACNKVLTAKICNQSSIRNV